MAYTRINWENGEAGDTPLNANNLNKMDAAIEMLDSKASDSDYRINTINAKLTQQDAAISGKMDKSNPSASGTLSVPQISVGKLSNYGGYDVTLPATVQIEDEQGEPSSILGAFNYIRDVAFPKINKNEQAIGEINNKLSGLGNEYLTKVNPMAQGTLVVDSTSPISSGQILINSEQGSAGTVISGGLVYTLLGNFAFDIDLGTSSDYTDEPVLKVGKTINEMKKDINSLKKNVGTVVLTDKSPLPACSASNILGIDALGKSTQNTTQTLNCASGSFAFAVGSAINSASQTSANRCNSGVVSLSAGSVVSISSGYSIALAKASTESGNIESTELWASSHTISANAYYRFLIKKNDDSAITPALFTVTATSTPTPTNPIPIIDASGEVVAIGENLWGEINLESGSLSSSDGSETTSTVYTRTKFIPLYGNATVTLFADNWIRYFFYSESKAFISTASAQPLNGLVVNVPSNAKYVRAHINYPIASVGEHNIMIAYGSKTEYVPYQSNFITLPTLKSIDDEEEKLIVSEDGIGYIRRKIGEYTFDGSEDFAYTANWGGLHAFTWRGLTSKIMPIPTNDTYGRLMHPNFYASTRNITSVSAKEGMMAQNTANEVFFCTNQYTSASEFANAMKGTTLYYEMLTPYNEMLTESQIAEIRQLMTYKGTTIIESELQIDSVTYSGDVKGYVDGKTDYSYMDTIIGRWLNEGDLHRMVIQTTTPSANSAVKVADIINATIANIKSINGMIVVNDTNQTPINYWYDASNYTSAWNAQDGIRMKVGATYANKPCEIIVEYTLKDSAPAAASVLSLDEETEE